MTNIPTLYAADSLSSAALENVFHDVEHVPSPSFLRSRLTQWSYSKLRTTRKILVLSSSIRNFVNSVSPDAAHRSHRAN
jgi:hypothetical protein